MPDPHHVHRRRLRAVVAVCAVKIFAFWRETPCSAQVFERVLLAASYRTDDQFLLRCRHAPVPSFATSTLMRYREYLASRKLLEQSAGQRLHLPRQMVYMQHMKGALIATR